MKGEYYYNQMSFWTRAKFKDNIRDLFNRHLSSDYNCLRHFVTRAFDWKNTREGYEYWKNVARGIDPDSDNSAMSWLTNELRRFLSGEDMESLSDILAVAKDKEDDMIVNEYQEGYNDGQRSVKEID